MYAFVYGKIITEKKEIVKGGVFLFFSNKEQGIVLPPMSGKSHEKAEFSNFFFSFVFNLSVTLSD